MPYPTQENYFALAVAILGSCPPETAFERLDKGKQRGFVARKDLTKDDDREMARLKKTGAFYREIGDLYGLSPGAVYNRIRKVEGRI